MSGREAPRNPQEARILALFDRMETAIAVAPKTIGKRTYGFWHSLFNVILSVFARNEEDPGLVSEAEILALEKQVGIIERIAETVWRKKRT